MEFEKYKLFKPEYANVDYDSASDVIISHAKRRESFSISALAVHGLITSLSDEVLGVEINRIDMIVPDGQPVRWALNSFYNLGMRDRVYGPELTLRVLKKANEQKLNIYLFGSTSDTLSRFKSFINRTYPDLTICGVHVDRFRDATPEEDLQDISKINASGAHIVLVGRGCPRQEIWVAQHKDKIHAAMMAVGAAFDFHAGTLRQAPVWMQKNGLEWLFRLIQEPKRLAKRYFITNSQFIYLFMKYKLLRRKPY